LANGNIPLTNTITHFTNLSERAFVQTNCTLCAVLAHCFAKIHGQPTNFKSATCGPGPSLLLALSLAQLCARRRNPHSSSRRPHTAGPSGRAVKGVGLLPLAFWDSVFESRRGHGCLSVAGAVFRYVKVFATARSLVQSVYLSMSVIRCNNKLIHRQEKVEEVRLRKKDSTIFINQHMHLYHTLLNH
jgi:hypothetical protein